MKAEIFYHICVMSIASGMVIALATFRPLEPNVIIACVEIVICLWVVGMAVAKIVKDMKEVIAKC